jgi:hypothetical protein
MSRLPSPNDAVIVEAIAKILSGKKVSGSLVTYLEQLTNLDAADDFGYTLVHHVVRRDCRSPRGSLQLLNELLGAGAQVNCQTPDGYTPLHYAARSNHLELAKLLLSYGADAELTILKHRFKGCRPVDLAQLYKARDVLPVLAEVSSSPPRLQDILLLKHVDLINYDALEPYVVGKANKRGEPCPQCHEPVLYEISRDGEGSGLHYDTWKSVLCENCGGKFIHNYNGLAEAIGLYDKREIFTEPERK